MALMKGIYVDTEGKEHIVDLKLNADGKLEISGLQVDTLEMGSLQIASGSDASELQITNGAAKEIPLASNEIIQANTTLTETFVSEDIDLNNFRNARLFLEIGTATGSGTVTGILHIMSQGTPYDVMTLDALIASNTKTSDSAYFEAGLTGRVEIRIAGFTNVAGVKCELQMKS